MSAAIHLHDPQTLCRHWEGEQRNPWSIEPTLDREQWKTGLTDDDQALVYEALSSLMVAEERVTTKFAGLVMAAENEEEARPRRLPATGSSPTQAIQPRRSTSSPSITC